MKTCSSICVGARVRVRPTSDVRELRRRTGVVVAPFPWDQFPWRDHARLELDTVGAPERQRLVPIADLKFVEMLGQIDLFAPEVA